MSVLQHLFSYGSADSLGDRLFFRIFEAFVVLCTLLLVWTWAGYIQNLLGITEPLGLARYFDLSWLFLPGVPWGIAALLTGCCLLGYLRRFPAQAYTAALLLFHVLYVARFSMGKASHGSNLIGMSLMGLAVGAVFFKDDVERRRFTLGFVYFFVGLAYLLAAGSKLIGTGLLWPDGHHLWMWLAERHVDVQSMTGRTAINAMEVFLNTHYAVATGVLSLGLATECLGWMFWFNRTRVFITLNLVALHLGIAFIMKIDFSLYVAELLLIGLPWAPLLNRVLGTSPRSALAIQGPKPAMP